YGATTTESGSFSTGSFTGSITSLICATAYHYAAYGTNTAGTGHGSDTTFTTDACASSGGGGGGGSGSSGGGSSTVSAGQLPVVTTEVMTTVTETVLRPDDFSDDLDVGSTDDQVLKLQKHLNKHGFKVNDKGAGSPGLETTYFGDATRKAVMAYQKAHGIIPPNGKIGSKTREALNKEAKEDALSGNSSATSVVKTLVTTPVVTKTGAEVHGELVSLGKSPVTVRGFAYGPTAVYGATTTESGQFSLGSFTRTISSLRCQTTYHYASYATNGSGTGYGRDMTFTTSSCAGVDEPITTPPVMTPPPAVVCPYLTKPINMGNNNDPVEVRRLQQFLGTPVTGIYSNTDYQAVKRFQETYKDDILTSLHLSNGTGAVSTNTLKKINALMCGTTPPPVTPPQTPQPVPPPVIPTTQPIPQPVSCTSSPTYSLDLSVGSQNNEVLILQRFLNAHGYVLAASGPGSPGNETNLYGTLTEAAVKNLQRINSISPVTGTVGPKTRRLLNCGTVNSIPPAGASTEIPGPGATPPITSSTKPTVITGTSTELKESTAPSSSRQ
ncbi:MAG: hypothetical protein JWN18_497, partial [Parcubacteria group bacterium]|nr:hypothetical protein [Parcubacteria group bacterium]